MGAYLPLSTTLPIFVGGMIRGFVERKKGGVPSHEDDLGPGSLFSTGLVAGGALAGVLVAFLVAGADKLKEGGNTSLQGLLDSAQLSRRDALRARRGGVRAARRGVFRRHGYGALSRRTQADPRLSGHVKISRLLSLPAAWLIGAAPASCGHETAMPRAGSAPGAPAAEMAPTPYTAEQIRAANGPGTSYRFKLETSGEPAQIKVMEFTSGTSAEIAEVKSQTLDEAGNAKGAASVERTPWDEIRRHAEFPRAGLTVEPGSIAVPAGKFESMVYTVNAPNGETARFYFAKSYAGPPVLFYKERGGVRLMTMTLLERKSGG